MSSPAAKETAPVPSRRGTRHSGWGAFVTTLAAILVQAGSARGAQIGDPWDRLDRLVCSEGLIMQCGVSNGNTVRDEEYNYTDHHCRFSKNEHLASNEDNQKINHPRLQINFKQQEVKDLDDNKIIGLTYISSSPKIITFVTGDYEVPQVISLVPIRDKAKHDLFVWSSATSFSYSTIGPDGTQRYLESSYYLSRYTCYPE
jgi:hypothetical protein